MYNSVIRIVVQEGAEKGRIFDFNNNAQCLLIGRAKEADLRLSEDDLYISRRHCLIKNISPNIYVIKDLRSKNGTWINSLRVYEKESHRINNGDQIHIGNSILRVEILSDSKRDNLLHRPHTREEYTILEEIGEGGMGEVFRAIKKSTGETVAFKWLYSPYINRRVLRLFNREVEAMKGLQHPNIVKFIDCGEKDGRPFLVSEYMSGGDIGALILKREMPFSIEDACRIACDILDGIAYAHDKGYIHRDIKPENILLDNEGVAKLSDFSFAKHYMEAGGLQLTEHGEVRGTLIYMAPEQIRGSHYMKPQADLYSLGVTLFYMLTGEFPYPVPSTLQRQKGTDWRVIDEEKANYVLHAEPTSLKEISSHFPNRLSQIIERALKKEPEQRYQTAAEMRGDLEDCY